MMAKEHRSLWEFQMVSAIFPIDECQDPRPYHIGGSYPMQVPSVFEWLLMLSSSAFVKNMLR